MPYQIENFQKIFSIIKPLYLLIITGILSIYVVISWVGRFNSKLKYKIFRNGPVDTIFHIVRYTIGPTLILLLLLLNLFIRILEDKTDWLDYGNKYLFLIFIVTLIFIIIFSLAVEILATKKDWFGNDPKKIKCWIPFLVITVIIIVFIIIIIPPLVVFFKM
jgi:hypothetical protein